MGTTRQTIKFLFCPRLSDILAPLGSPKNFNPPPHNFEWNSSNLHRLSINLVPINFINFSFDFYAFLDCRVLFFCSISMVNMHLVSRVFFSKYFMLFWWQIVFYGAWYLHMHVGGKMKLFRSSRNEV